MKLKDLYEIADGIAPFALSAEFQKTYGAYDNSGIQLDFGFPVRGVLFSLDLSLEAEKQAENCGANVIFTHHPAIYEGLKRATEEETPALCECMKAGISVISAHLNLDCAPGGIDECLMRVLGGETSLKLYEPLSLGGYGRVFQRAACPPEEFLQEISLKFRTNRTLFYGKNQVKRIASFCGAGFEPGGILFALECGADTLVTSDGKHHLIAEGVSRGLNVVLLTHYAAENYGFFEFYKAVKSKIEIPCRFFADERFL